MHIACPHKAICLFTRTVNMFFMLRDIQIRAAETNVKSVTSLQTPTERVGQTGYLII